MLGLHSPVGPLLHGDVGLRLQGARPVSPCRRSRPVVVAAAVQEAPASRGSRSTMTAPDFVYLERILDPHSSALMCAPPRMDDPRRPSSAVSSHAAMAASSSSPSGGQHAPTAAPMRRNSKTSKGGLLDHQGEYMCQVRMLETIYIRARSSARDPPHAWTVSPAQQQQQRRRRHGKDSKQGRAAWRAQAPLHMPAGLDFVSGDERRLPEAEASTWAPEPPPQRQGHASGGSLKEAKLWSLRAKVGVQVRARPASALTQPVLVPGSDAAHANATKQPGVREILGHVARTSSEETLAKALKQASPAPVAANNALVALGCEGRHQDLTRLLHAMVSCGCVNEYSHAMAISSLDQAGRFDLAMQHFEDLCRQEQDVGPVCSSVLIKLCAQRRDLPLALDIFYRLSGQSTLNRFTYNCLIHLCAVLGHVEQALSVLAMMHEDGGPDTLPDSYTYAELLKAVVNSRRWKMLPLIYRQIQRSQVELSSEVWCLLVVAAGRAKQPDLARQVYEDSCSKMDGSFVHVHNALLGAVARHTPLPEMLALYRQMLERGLRPDEYTFNALLTTMSKVGASLYAVEDLVTEMCKWDVKINTHLGTTLINAYNRCPEMTSQDPRLTTLLLEKAHDVLLQLQAQRQANSHTFGSVMVMHAALGDAAGVQRLLAQMRHAGVALDGKTCTAVAQGFEDGGFMHLAEQFLRHTQAPSGAGAGAAGVGKRGNFGLGKKKSARW